MRTVKYLTLSSVVILLASVAFADTPPSQPTFKNPDANAAYVAYDKAVAAAKAELIRSLIVAQDKATKAGDLDEAVKIRDIVKGLQVPIAPTVTGGPQSPFVGYWEKFSMRGNIFFLLTADGHAVYFGNEIGNGTWQLLDNGSAVIRWDSGETMTYGPMSNGAIEGLEGGNHPAARTKATKRTADQIPSGITPPSSP